MADKHSTLCILCCEEIDIYSCGKCEHSNICFKCSTRLRVLCKEKYCPVCRADLPKVVFTKHLKQYESLIAENKGYLENRQFGLLFANAQIQANYKALLSHKCQLCKDRPPEKTLDHLKTHMSRQHQLYYCDICVEHLKIFTSERSYYNRSDLARHRRVGDVNNKSHKGHPLCQFCDKRFLDNDELLRHLRQVHFFCHLCDKTEVYQYYSDYESLHEHFKDSHFLCEEDECLTDPFTSVFATKIDLKAHKAIKHIKNLTKSQAKQARILDVEVKFKRRLPMGQVAGADYDEINKKEQSKTDREDALATTKENGPRLNQALKNWPGEEEIENKMRDDIMPRKLDNALASGGNEVTHPGSNNRVKQNGTFIKEKKDLTLDSLVANWYSEEDTMVHPEVEESFPRLSSVNNYPGNFNASWSSKENFPVLNSLNAPNMPGLSSLKSRKMKTDVKGVKKEKQRENNAPISSSITKAIETEPSITLADSANNFNILNDFPSLAEVANQLVENNDKVLENVTNPSPPGFLNSQKSKSTSTKIGKEYNFSVQYHYFEPPNFQERIKILKENTMKFLNNNVKVFSSFKEMSVKYRRGYISAEDYYVSCNKLFSASNLVQIYPELIALLPDISKQQQLLLSYNKFSKKAKLLSGQKKGATPNTNVWNVNKKGTNLVSCRVCSQVLIESDYSSHIIDVHEEDKDFPSLSSKGRSK